MIYIVINGKYKLKNNKKSYKSKIYFLNNSRIQPENNHSFYLIVK